MDICVKKAYAKINLGLDVLGVLPNGYHQVKMIMQTVGIYDRLTLTRRTDERIVITTDAGELPTGPDNLIYKAVRLLQENKGVSYGVDIHLEKKIPIAAGMAGGSTDAAAAMKGYNELYGLGFSKEQLQLLGVKIGADVPYCIMGGTVLAEGIGEKLTMLPPAPQSILVVVKPDQNVSTRDVYRSLDACEKVEHPDIDGMIAAMAAEDQAGMIQRLGNVLEPVTIRQCAVIPRIEERMKELGALGCLMSGSGPTVFGFFATEGEARQALEKLLAQKELRIRQGFVTTFQQNID